MSDAPERIWASTDWRRIDQGKWWDINPGGDAEEYIRTDTIPSPEALIRAALNAAIRAVEPSYDEPSVDPSNTGDVVQYAAWCSDMRSADLIRSIAADPEAVARIIKAAEGRG